MRDKLIEGNAASKWTWGRGGGLYIDRGYDVRLDGNVVVGNATSSNPASTAFGGGGPYLLWSDAIIVNTVVADNRSGARGSGGYASDCSSRFLHTTITRNGGGDGTGLYVTEEYDNYGTLAMTNTIMVSHTVAIPVTGGNTATLSATLWRANRTDAGGEGTVLSGTPSTSGDPALAVDGYHVTGNSAAVDEGLEAG